MIIMKFLSCFTSSFFVNAGYDVTSNLESGVGRALIIIKDTKNRPIRAACIEVKWEKEENSDLNSIAKEALKPIEDRKYDESLGLEQFRIIRWGTAFHKKTCVAQCQKYTQQL